MKIDRINKKESDKESKIKKLEEKIEKYQL